MQIVTYYICPVCGEKYTEQHEAIACRNKHDIKTEEWTYCEACGAGWNVNAIGEKNAVEHAKECEDTHRKKGEFEKVKQAYMFFLNGFNK